MDAGACAALLPCMHACAHRHAFLSVSQLPVCVSQLPVALLGPGLTWPCCPLQVGTPERPLSDLGVVSYRGYWTRVLLKVGQGLGLQQGATLLASAV